MTAPQAAPDASADDSISRLEQAGLPAHAAESVLKIDAMMQSWRRRISKREIGLSALRELGLDLDLAQLDVLMAIAAPRNEFGLPGAEETLVGTVAERLSIDPSRASRLVSEMVDQGYVERRVSQTDSRRTVLALTRNGTAIVEAVRMFKFYILGDFLSGWSEEELATFLPLLARFSAWTDGVLDGRSERFHTEIRQLADSVAKQIQSRPGA